MTDAYAAEWWQKKDRDKWTHIAVVKNTGVTNTMMYVNGVLQPPDPVEFVTGEGRVYGARYYTVYPKNGEHLWANMMQWMVDTFGPTPADGVWTPGSIWYANNAKFWFRREEDMSLFLLKWTQ